MAKLNLQKNGISEETLERYAEDLLNVYNLCSTSKGLQIMPSYLERETQKNIWKIFNGKNDEFKNEYDIILNYIGIKNNNIPHSYADIVRIFPDLLMRYDAKYGGEIKTPEEYREMFGIDTSSKDDQLNSTIYDRDMRTIESGMESFSLMENQLEEEPSSLIENLSEMEPKEPNLSGNSPFYDIIY